VFESQEAKPAQALLHNGASRLGAFSYGTLPVVAPELTSYVIFRWECAIRSSVILGFVGAGGLGQQMDLSMKMLAGDQVFTMLIAFMMLVAVADWISKRLRRAFERETATVEASAAILATATRGLVTVALIVLAFVTLKGTWSDLFSIKSMASMTKLMSDFFPPALDQAFLSKVAVGTLETLAISFLGTVIAIAGAVILAIGAAGFTLAHAPNLQALLRSVSRLVLNALRAVPELVWASMLVIAAGLGPMAGTLALALHTIGVLGRLLADAFENAPREPYNALRINGASNQAAFWYGTLPTVLPQLISYALYRWENNIRAAAVLGVVGGGGLGQLLYYHMGLFHFGESCTVLIAMLLLVAVVDWVSGVLRYRLVNT
jgi:phosphonate transport system permease protein